MRRKKRSNWDQFVLDGVNGFFILREGNKLYGPFRTKEIAEFFNFISFVAPRSLEAANESKQGVAFKRGVEKAHHPRELFQLISPFKAWWQDTYGTVLNESTALALARTCGTNGYEGFTSWLVSSGKIDGKYPHQQIN